MRKKNESVKIQETLGEADKNLRKARRRKEKAIRVLSILPYTRCQATMAMIARDIFGKVDQEGLLEVRRAIQDLTNYWGIPIQEAPVKGMGGAREYWIPKWGYAKADALVEPLLRKEFPEKHLWPQAKEGWEE